MNRKQPPAHAARSRARLTRTEREKQLLDVALRLFIERGYQGTSIEELARAAGVTRPIIYAHFGSKDGIYLACLRRARQELDARFAAISGISSDLTERLRLGIDAYFGFVESHREAWSILFGGGVAVAGPAAEEATRMRFATVKGITELMTGVLPHVDRRTLEAYSHAVSGAGEQLAKWWLDNPALTREQMTTYMQAFAWHGLQRLSALPAKGRKNKKGQRRPSTPTTTV